MALLSSYLTINILNRNGLYSTEAESDRQDLKNETQLYAAYKIQFSLQDIYKLKVKRWKKIFLASGNQRKTAIAIHMSDKIDINSKAVIRDKESHYLPLKDFVCIVTSKNCNYIFIPYQSN